MNRKEKIMPWEDANYRKIKHVKIQDEYINIEFENGDNAKLSKQELVSNDTSDILWDSLNNNVFEITINTKTDVLEIPWDKIRVLTDKKFAKYLAGEAEDEAKYIGIKLKQLRENKDITGVELAERAGITPQTISRIERGHTDVSFTTLRKILAAMGYSLKDLANEDNQVIDNIEKSFPALIKRMENIGIDRNLLIKKIIPSKIIKALQKYKSSTPELLLDEAATYIGHVYGWTLNDIWEKQDLSVNTNAVAFAFFKKPHKTNINQIRAYTHYAYYLANTILKISKINKEREYPKDLEEFKNCFLYEYNAITFENLLKYTWSFGICVLPLNDSGVFHGASWNINGKHIIIIKQNTKYHSRWIFDLLHEVYHVFADLDADNSFLIEDEELNPFSITGDQKELEANTFANHFIFETNADILAQKCIDRANWKIENLKQAVQDISNSEQVDKSFLANYLAFRLNHQGHNWWGTAAKFQSSSPDPFKIAVKILRENIKMESLNAIDFNLLNSAIQEEKIEAEI